MNVLLYKFSGKRNELEKTIHYVSQRQGTFKKSQTLMNIELTLKANETSLLSSNYCYVDVLERYYFIDDIEIVGNGLFTLKLSEDVLMSHKEDIKRMLVEIDESENPNGEFLSCDVRSEKTLLRSESLFNPFTENKLYMLTVQGV